MSARLLLEGVALVRDPPVEKEPDGENDET